MAGASNDVADAIGGIILLAAVALFVRPGSQGTGLVTAFLSGFNGLVGTATGGAWNAKKGTSG